MRKISGMLLCLCVLAPSALQADTFDELRHRAIGTEIASSGETVLVAKTEKTSVRVRIGVHEELTTKRSDGWADTDRVSCGYGGNPCSFVDYIKIAVNDKPIFVGRSVYCDMAGLNRATIEVGEEESTLLLIGGDGADSYVVKIVFDSEHVKRRNRAGLGEPEKPLQETTYHIVVVGD